MTDAFSVTSPVLSTRYIYVMTSSAATSALGSATLLNVASGVGVAIVTCSSADGDVKGPRAGVASMMAVLST